MFGLPFPINAVTLQPNSNTDSVVFEFEFKPNANLDGLDDAEQRYGSVFGTDCGNELFRLERIAIESNDEYLKTCNVPSWDTATHALVREEALDRTLQLSVTPPCASARLFSWDGIVLTAAFTLEKSLPTPPVVDTLLCAIRSLRFFQVDVEQIRSVSAFVCTSTLVDLRDYIQKYKNARSEQTKQRYLDLIRRGFRRNGDFDTVMQIFSERSWVDSDVLKLLAGMI